VSAPIVRAAPFALAVVFAAVAACETTPSPSKPEGQTATSAGALTTFEVCQQDALARGLAVKKQGGSDAAARKATEAAFALCEDPARTQGNAAFLGAFNADFARLGVMVAAGKLSAAEYSVLLGDRRLKYEAMVTSPSEQDALAAGDADGDLVPDRSDRCPGTLYGLATDRSGCPTTEPPRGDRTITAALSGATTLYNPSCTDAPPPIMPLPLEWGRGAQTSLGTMGYNLWVSRSGGQPAGCEIFYEFDLRFTNPAVAGSPPVLYAHMVMGEGEDLLGAATSATFGLPVGKPLSPGRTAVRDAMGNYGTVSWKVRAVNGSQVASPWSPIRTAGPASSGVPG
jgi:hypothetical protein